MFAKRKITVGMTFPRASSSGKHLNQKTETHTVDVTELFYTLHCAYRRVRCRDRSGRDVFPGRILCPEHHATLGSQSDDDRPAASPQQLLGSSMRLLRAGYRGAREQLSLPGDTRFSINTHAHAHACTTFSI